MRRVQAANLSGYGSPLFPEDEIRQLVQAFTSWSQAGCSVRTMDKIALRCPGFTTANRLLRTSDNYIWRRIIEFRVGDSRVAVAIPMTGDGEFADGVMLDRSPAAYIADGATEVTAKVVLVALARVMHR